MAEQKRDCYEVLGIPKDADDAAIKKAYRTLAKKYHPDANPGDKEAEAKFKEASEAYAILIDPDKRSKYDQFGHAAFDNMGPGGGASYADMNDIFSEFFGGGGMGDIFGSMFGGGGRQRANAPMQGASVRAAIRISFDESIKGCKKTLSLNLKDDCPHCHGTGAKEGTSPVTCGKCGGSGVVMTRQQTMFGMMQSQGACPDCHGTGKIIKEKCSYCHGSGYVQNRQNIEVEIPAGIDDGQSVRVRGKGEPGVNGGPRGDLLVQVEIVPSPLFAREGIDIFSNREISIAQAALGDTIRIPTVDGEVEYTLKAGTQPDSRIRLRGKGVPYVRDPRQRGDHYVTFVVKIPEKLSKKQKDALIEFDKTMGGTRG